MAVAVRVALRLALVKVMPSLELSMKKRQASAEKLCHILFGSFMGDAAEREPGMIAHASMTQNYYWSYALITATSAAHALHSLFSPRNAQA